MKFPNKHRNKQWIREWNRTWRVFCSNSSLGHSTGWLFLQKHTSAWNIPGAPNNQKWKGHIVSLPTIARNRPDRALWPKATLNHCSGRINDLHATCLPNSGVSYDFMLFPDAMCIIAIFCGSRVGLGCGCLELQARWLTFFSLLTVEQLGCANAVCLHSTQKLLARLSYFGRGYAKSRKSAVCTLI